MKKPDLDRPARFSSLGSSAHQRPTSSQRPRRNGEIQLSHHLLLLAIPLTWLYTFYTITCTCRVFNARHRVFCG
jgi:hypothetical protein